MALCDSFSIFLVIAVFFSCCTIGNAQEETKAKWECQGSVVRLKCNNLSYILNIVSVFYGRKQPGNEVCRSPMDSYLSDETTCEINVDSQVRTLCHENSCNITLSEQSLGTDSCPSVYKYIHLEYRCVDSKKFARGKVARRASPTPLVVMATSTSKVMTTQVLTTKAIRPTSTMVANVEILTTVCSSEVTSMLVSSSLSSSRTDSVSVTPVTDTSVPTTENIKTTKPASKNYENSSTLSGQHGTMKLFRFIVSFHIIHEEHIHKRTASSVVWFMFGLLVGLFMMIAVLVYYRVKQVQRARQNKPNKAAYFKQKDCSDGTFDEKVILHPKQFEALEMESQCGEAV